MLARVVLNGPLEAVPQVAEGVGLVHVPPPVLKLIWAINLGAALVAAFWHRRQRGRIYHSQIIGGRVCR